MEDDRDTHPFCWICLGCDDPQNTLIKPCTCPRSVHPKCLATWQINNIGKDEESACRFCSKAVPDWRDVFVKPDDPSPVTMGVVFGTTYHKIPIHEHESVEDFTDKIRTSFGLPQTQEINICYTWKQPITKHVIHLDETDGSGADARAHLYESVKHLAKYKKGCRREKPSK